ncbi:hypothetical protein ABT364_23385 [Massilia sp. SR12]
MDTTKSERYEERVRQLELKVEAMAQAPENLRSEFRTAILESEMRMKEYVDQRFERVTEYVDQRFTRLEGRVDFQFKIVMSTLGAVIAGLTAIAVRLLML